MDRRKYGTGEPNPNEGRAVKLKSASRARIKSHVLAYRDGVLESSLTVMIPSDARQVRMAMNLQGYDASIEDILANAKPFHP